MSFFDDDKDKNNIDDGTQAPVEGDGTSEEYGNESRPEADEPRPQEDELEEFDSKVVGDDDGSRRDESYRHPEDMSDEFMVQQEEKDSFRDKSEMLKDKFSAVAMSSKYTKLVAAIFVLVGLVTAYTLIFGGEPSQDEIKLRQQQERQKNKEQRLEEAKEVAKPSDDIDALFSDVDLDSAGTLVEPTPPEPPPPPIPDAPSTNFTADTPVSPPVQAAPLPSFGEVNEPSTITPPSFTQAGGSPPEFGAESKVRGVFKKDDEEAKRRAQALAKKRKANMIIFGSGASSVDSITGEDAAKKEKKKNSGEFLGFGDGQFGSAVNIATTSATTVTATHMGNTRNLIAQGKLLNAVLESAINTDLPGTLRAIISRDVYAESGKKVLIPKGSRIIGEYDSTIKDGQVRVAVIWKRIMRPDGIDVAVDSGGSDHLGRAGVAGAVDNKFWQRIGTAFMVSYVIPIASRKLANVNDSAISSTQTTDAGGNTTTTTNSTTAGQEIKDASDEFGDIVKESIEKSFSDQPTITVNQGTRLTIFVQKDMVMPDINKRTVNTGR
jgi:type IV secretion system protein VirB10